MDTIPSSCESKRHTSRGFASGIAEGKYDWGQNCRFSVIFQIQKSSLDVLKGTEQSILSSFLLSNAEIPEESIENVLYANITCYPPNSLCCITEFFSSEHDIFRSYKRMENSQQNFP